MKRHAPATARNSAAIADVLRKELPKTGSVLEIASGSGEHAIYLAREFPDLLWHPTDYDFEALDSIRAWTQETRLANIAPPQRLDASTPPWDVPPVNAIFCCNMIHISPWAASEGLLRGAGEVLPENAPLILYGPFIEHGVETSESNLQFDASLKSRDPEWGLRDIADIDQLAKNEGLERTNRYTMPANNLTLIYRRLPD